MIVYNEDKMRKSLDSLPAALRVVFSASCAERSFPFYCEYSKKGELDNSYLIRNALDGIWSEAEGNPLGLDLKAEIERCKAIIPDELDEASWSPEMSYAGDMVFSMIYTLCARLGGDTQDAVWAARHSYNAIDSFVEHLISDDPFSYAPAEAVISHPLVQKELACQECDLIELRSIEADARRTVVSIRNRAKEDGEIFFRNRSDSNNQ